MIHPTIASLRAAIRAARSDGRKVGFVPTMGALHEGHAELIRRARAECGFVVVSLFVNPIQFDRKDDFNRYPRPMDEDVALCASLGVDAIFAPSDREMYPTPPQTFVEVPALSEKLCGEYRPGHFRGVATVVAKLFQIALPDFAYFGEKDAQQLAVIERMVLDLNMPVTVVPVPTIREADGLALSSRNRRLSPAERAVAPALYRALAAARDRIANGATDPASVRDAALAILAETPDFRVEYLEVIDPATQHPVSIITGPVRISAAAWLGQTRLIDNVIALVPTGG